MDGWGRWTSLGGCMKQVGVIREMHGAGGCHCADR